MKSMIATVNSAGRPGRDGQAIFQSVFCNSTGIYLLSDLEREVGARKVKALFAAWRQDETAYARLTCATSDKCSFQSSPACYSLCHKVQTTRNFVHLWILLVVAVVRSQVGCDQDGKWAMRYYKQSITLNSRFIPRPCSKSEFGRPTRFGCIQELLHFRRGGYYPSHPPSPHHLPPAQEQGPHAPSPPSPPPTLHPPAAYRA